MIDFIYVVRGVIRMYVYVKPPSHYLGQVKPERYPVIILPGYLMRWGFMKSIADEVSLLGHPVYVLPYLGNKDIISSAKIISKLIEENNLKNIIIVGHSKGGLIGKYLLVNFNKNEKVRGLIAIETPFYGTSLANYFRFVKSNEFYPGHPIIKDLSEHPEVNKKIITISARFDEIIWSSKKGSLDGALENINVGTVGHHKLVFDKEVVEKIISSIDKLSN